MANRQKHLGLLVIAGIALAGPAWAEGSAPGVLTGHVLDRTGSPLRGVMVAAARKPPETLVEWTSSNDEGAFRISGLPPGLYDVTAGAPGLKRLTKRDVAVTAGPIPDLDLVMEVEAMVERVRVVEKAPLISTVSSLVYRDDFTVDCCIGCMGTRDSLYPVLSRPSDIEGVAAVTPGWRFGPPIDAAHPADNPFLGTPEHPRSTFSVDVDRASYAQLHGWLSVGALPPRSSVRIEDMLNHLPSSQPAPVGDEAMAVVVEVNDCPWNSEARLVRIGIRGRERPSGTQVLPAAREVSTEVVFNPARVVAYRLIGYEDRLSGKGAGGGRAVLGAGQTVTALYEIVPSASRAQSSDLLTVEARYKLPDGWFSKTRRWPARDDGAHLGEASADFRFAAAVAAFGMILRQSPHRGAADHDLVLRLVGEARDLQRRDLLELVREARDLGALPPALSSR